MALTLLGLAYLASLFIFQLTVCVSWKINNTAKYANSANIGAKEIKIGWLDGREEGEDTAIGFVGIAEIFATQVAIFF